MFMKKIGDLTTEYSDVKPLKEKSWPDEKNFPEHLKESVFIKHIKGPLFFGSTSDFQRVPRIIHFMFRKTIAKKDRGKRKDEGGGRKKKAGGKGR